MAEEKTFYVSFFLTREKSNNDDESWFDKKHISDEIKSWLSDIDYQVSEIKIFNTVINDYHEKKADILWEYISDKHTSEIMKRLEGLENDR